jgi:hypothetical protein
MSCIGKELRALAEQAVDLGTQLAGRNLRR